MQFRRRWVSYSQILKQGSHCVPSYISSLTCVSLFVCFVLPFQHGGLSKSQRDADDTVLDLQNPEPKLNPS